MPEISYHPAIDYPETDGQPIAESDATRYGVQYCIEVLQSFFGSRRNVYVSGNLFIYYREGDPKSVISPDVFVIFGVTKRNAAAIAPGKKGTNCPHS